MSVKDGLLALLARGPSYGYQLRADFEDITGGAWSVNIGQVYTSLQRLERDGLIAEVPDGGDADRRSYEVTAAGREHLVRWLSTPEARTIEDRDEVTMKVLLAAATPGHDVSAVIDAQRRTTMAALQEHTRRKATARDGSLAEVLHLDRLVLICRAELDWLDLAEARIEGQRQRDRAGGNGHPTAASSTSEPAHDSPKTRGGTP